VFGIHGVGGALGTLLCGVFAVAALSDAPGTPGTAGLLEGNSGQVLIQLYGIAVTAVWSGVATFIILKVIEFMVPLRVSQQSEIEGLDVTQHGEALQ
jgi:Amt family ammonium transporter